MSLRSLAILLLGLSFVSCASAPPPAKPLVLPVVPEAAKVQTVDLVCNEKARYVSFDKLSVPVGASPVDVALTRDSIWVLFPERLVQIGRGGGEQVGVRMQLAPSGEVWAKLAVDPVDESIW